MALSTAQRPAAVDLIDAEATTRLRQLAEQVERIVADFESRLAAPCAAALLGTMTALSVLRPPSSSP